MKLIIRADADTRMGTGHVMRCLALAQACQDAGGSAVVASNSLPAALHDRLAAEKIEVIGGSSAQEAVAAAHSVNADWIVVDGYQFDAHYQAGIIDAGYRLLWIDDDAQAAPYCATIVLNQNPHAHHDSYARRNASTRLLLGPRYALLRREFLLWRGWKRETNTQAGKVLVTLGGGDPENVTLEVVKALQSIPDAEAVVIVGATNPHFATLQEEVRESPQIRLQANVTKMPELMAWADVAVAAAGSTCWELAFMGLPSLLVTMADNQRPLAEHLAAAGIAIDLGPHSQIDGSGIPESLVRLMTDPDLRAEMSRRGRELVDGNGASRVVQEMRVGTLALRRAEEADCRLIWQWSNDPAARAVAFTTHQIPWEEHLAWWHTHFNVRDCLIYIAVGEDGPAGQVRYDIDGDTATISINVAPAFRGRGYGTRIIELGSEALFASSGLGKIDAYVRPENTASIHAFLKAGFAKEEITTVRGFQAVRLTKRKGGHEPHD
jgi:UDP-2,4-diacetamido-2,4,6-trideoxy-beta-L-altropyranose hydrolase